MSERILTLFEELSPEAQRQAVEFMLFLKERARARRRVARGGLRAEKFIGLWQDRNEMTSSSDWVRETRRREWGG